MLMRFLLELLARSTMVCWVMCVHRAKCVFVCGVAVCRLAEARESEIEG